ncbi:regulatory protein GemA, partial [Escherichia coli]|nr:regulatory protein GemA [Escherichia coli]
RELRGYDAMTAAYAHARKTRRMAQ